MLVSMDRTAYKALEDRALVWACIEPTISRIRGKGTDVKNNVFQELTPGQQGLFLFQIFYGHARSPAELFWFACDYLANGKLWARMKENLSVFGCGTLVNLYVDMERSFLPHVLKSAAEGREITVSDLDRSQELMRDAGRLFNLYRDAAGEAIASIAAYIRSKPEEFIRWTEVQA
ncbi:hypothetical protein [Gorillibacterium sp. sgz5001074]|uniref:hypothetical protein n=1 Tax=Gorillibacterium sp. sgz5001074 TaxID=3446695 RepID=UPI003F673DA3